MSEQELVGLIKNYLNEDTDTNAQSERERKVELKGNEVFSRNVGVPVYEYLDTVYFEKVKKYIEDTYEERIKKLEDRVESLEAKVK